MALYKSGLLWINVSETQDLGAATPPLASAPLNCSTSDCSLQLLSQETAWGLVVIDPDAPKTLAVDHYARSVWTLYALIFMTLLEKWGKTVCYFQKFSRTKRNGASGLKLLNPQVKGTFMSFSWPVCHQNPAVETKSGIFRWSVHPEMTAFTKKKCSSVGCNLIRKTDNKPYSG